MLTSYLESAYRKLKNGDIQSGGFYRKLFNKCLNILILSAPIAAGKLMALTILFQDITGEIIAQAI